MFNRSVFVFFFLTVSECYSLGGDVDSVNKRILGGSLPTSTHNGTSVASIRLMTSQGNFHVCGGFIINKRWVGTAAQCLTGKTVNNTIIAVSRPTITGGTLYEVEQIEKHNYNPLTLANDVGLLKTRREIIFTSEVTPISLGAPTQSHYSVQAFGWGRTTETGGLSETLRQAGFNTVDHETCLSRFPFVTRRFITDRQVCFHISNRATCKGDAGGPMIYNNTVVAIISWVDPCIAGQTSVHTRIGFYMNWILRFTRDDD